MTRAAPTVGFPTWTAINASFLLHRRPVPGPSSDQTLNPGEVHRTPTVADVFGPAFSRSRWRYSGREGFRRSRQRCTRTATTTNSRRMALVNVRSNSFRTPNSHLDRSERIDPYRWWHGTKKGLDHRQCRRRHLRHLRSGGNGQHRSSRYLTARTRCWTAHAVGHHHHLAPAIDNHQHDTGSDCSVRRRVRDRVTVRCNPAADRGHNVVRRGVEISGAGRETPNEADTR